MNEKYKLQIKKTNKSLYQISHETGIPYTILNELKNDKKNINHIASETVYKLSLYLDCNMGEIINPFPILKNCQGKYLGIKYKWVSCGNGVELFIYNNNRVTILTKIEPIVPRFYTQYQNVTKMLIEKYVNQEHIEENLL